MMDKDELHKLQEEQEVNETWRRISRHVVADLLEACSICGMVRERSQLNRCTWCKDVYLCPGECMHQHNSHMHPSVSLWPH